MGTGRKLCKHPRKIRERLVDHFDILFKQNKYFGQQEESKCTEEVIGHNILASTKHTF